MDKGRLGSLGSLGRLSCKQLSAMKENQGITRWYGDTVDEKSERP